MTIPKGAVKEGLLASDATGVSWSVAAALGRLPAGTPVELPGRGTTWARAIAGPDGPPPALLLHGWTATGDLNFAGVYETLARDATVVAVDHHGHGRGLRRASRFTLEEAADDAAALAAALGLGPVVAVGWSMGGAVAQVLWRRHPSLVAGLVLAGTAGVFATTTRERLMFRALDRAAVAGRSPAAQRSLVASLARSKHGDATHAAWVAAELAGHDWQAVLEAGAALGDFDSSPWLGAVDVPTAVVVTTDDRVVPTPRQLALARHVPGAVLHTLAGGHDVTLRHPDRFAARLLQAVRSVRAEAGLPAAPTAAVA